MSSNNEKRKRKNRPPPFDILPSIYPPENNFNLSDHFDMQINNIPKTIYMNKLESIGILGSGTYGIVQKMKDTESENFFAVKIIRNVLEKDRQNRLLNDLNISKRGEQCPFIIDSYGAMFSGGDIWIFMEVMDISLDKFYLQIDDGEYIDECHLVYIIFCMVSALLYLHRILKVIHRDVKPSNVLINRSGQLKICDFGISGFLIDSVVTTNVGSQAYLAPERIMTTVPNLPFDIRSDVWSLGLSIVEVALRHFPYQKWTRIIDQLNDVVKNDTVPSLPDSAPYSTKMRGFISRCLVKDRDCRAKYEELLEHELLEFLCNDIDFEESRVAFSNYVVRVLKI